jgi:hypothetical protein
MLALTNSSTMSTNPTDQSTEYEIDRVKRARHARTETERQHRLKKVCAAREKAIRLNNRVNQLRARIAAFDDPQSGFRAKVKAAQKWLGWTLFTILAVALIATADFWLAMPDVAEMLANKATSLIAHMQNTLGGTNTVDHDTVTLVTPVALRVCIGITIVCIFLMLTLGLKKCTDNTALRQSLARLAPGDDRGYRRVQSTIWLHRAGRIGYLALVTYFLCIYLYQFDLQRARAIVAVGSMEQTTTAKLEWPALESENPEAEPAANGAIASSAESGDPEQAARNLARPQMLVYALLVMLHGLLLLLPAQDRPDDLSLSLFDRGRAERLASKLEARKSAVLRDIFTTIRQAPTEALEALVLEAMPVATQINASIGHSAFKGTAEPTSGTTATLIPVEVVPARFKLS